MSRARKLCIVLPSHWAGNFGGAEYQVKLLLESLLSDYDAEVTYLARNVSETFSDDRYAIRRIRGILGPRRVGFWPDSLSLLRALGQEQPDVIYQRVGCAYTGIAAHYASRHGCRMIWHVSIDSDLFPDMGRFSGLTRTIERQMRDYGIRHADTIVVQSEAQRHRLEESFGRSSTVIRNFQPGPGSPVKKSPRKTVLWVANLKPAKRPNEFLQLAKSLAHRRDIRFIMIGRGGDERPYRSQVSAATDNSNFEYVGELPICEVNDLVAAGHILVNTSQDEGFPNTFIQAWYRKTAIVSLGVDPDGVLRTGGCGLVVDAPDRLSAAVTDLIDDDDRRDALTEAGFGYVKSHHSLENARQLADLICGS
jgi:glycosyltransferase involved in cell wall biosynthesis